ncbi:MAG: dTMP kinase [Candidatus Omnitrophica bacterium]|nr:dTMP kinase [Candidatus Omnitrophota bacterium]
MRAKFITFEGTECSGKSTQSRLLFEYLKSKYRKVIFLREPGGTKISEAIRRILLDPHNIKMADKTELLLYMASRAQTVEEVIRPALKNGFIVICDRFLDSTVVYQGYGLGMDLEFIQRLGEFVTEGITPDLTILLDIPLSKAFKKILRRKDRIEQRAFSYHRRVQQGYRILSKKFPERIKVVRLLDDLNSTQQRIRKIVDKIFFKDGV